MLFLSLDETFHWCKFHVWNIEYQWASSALTPSKRSSPRRLISRTLFQMFWIFLIRRAWKLILKFLKIVQKLVSKFYKQILVIITKFQLYNICCTLKDYTYLNNLHLKAAGLLRMYSINFWWTPWVESGIHLQCRKTLLKCQEISKYFEHNWKPLVKILLVRVFCLVIQSNQVLANRLLLS